MPKQILLEDTIERSILLCKEICQSVIFPVFDNSIKNSITSAKSGKKRKFLGNRRQSHCFLALEDTAKKRKTVPGVGSMSTTVGFLYQQICELMSCYAELARFNTLGDTTLHNLCSLATPVFFIDGISEIQIKGIRLLSTVFSTSPEMRRSVLHELLESLHRLPSNKSRRNCFRLNETTWISNFAVLMLQLIQSVVKVFSGEVCCYLIWFTFKVPSKRKNDALDETDDVQQNDITVEDAAVVESYQEAQSLAVLFLSGFLGK